VLGRGHGEINHKGRRRDISIWLFLMLEALMALGATTVFASKPLDPDHNVVAMSNGFPTIRGSPTLVY